MSKLFNGSRIKEIGAKFMEVRSIEELTIYDSTRDKSIGGL